MQRVRQKVVDARPGVSCAADSVGPHANRADFAAELERMIAARPTQIIDERQRIGCVRLRASVRRTIGAHESAGCRDSGVRTLSG